VKARRSNGPGVVWQYREVLALGCEWPYQPCPEPGGLLPFAAVNAVDHLNWLTCGPANTSDLAYFEFDGFGEVHLLEGDTFTRFLLKALSKGYCRPIDPGFEPPVAFKLDARA